MQRSLRVLFLTLSASSAATWPLACAEAPVAGAGDAHDGSPDGDIMDVAEVAEVTEVAEVMEVTPPDALGGEADAREDEAHEVAPSVCPTPPFGTAEGDTLADYELFACDGTPFRLSQVCDRPLTFMNLFAGWCPPCQSHAREAPSDYAALGADVPDAQWLFVITEDNHGETPSLDYCRAVVDGYGLSMTTLVDLNGGLPAHLGVTTPNAWYVVLSAGLGLKAKVKYDKDAALARARELAP